MKHRKMLSWLLTAALATGFLSFAPAAAADTHFTPNPQTAYARQFIEQCDGQQWLIDETERLLNVQQKTLDTITSQSDLDIVKSLGLKNKGINGAIPRAIGEFRELRYLFLSENQLSGSIPAELFSLPKLQNVDLGDNAYTIPIPAGFGGMAALTHLNLRENTFTGSIPQDILQNKQIEFLDVSSNKLTGKLPAALSGMTALTYLAVSDNAWGGTLPDLSALAKLQSLSLWNCKLTGEIPDTLYTLTSLQVLDLAGNSLTGGLKPAIGSLVNLQLLSVGTNDLHGEIPAALGALTKLQTLDLSDNVFSGLLPDAFGALTALKEVHIENNQLRGMIPDSLKARYDAGTTVYAQNNYMTGMNLRDMKNNEKNFADGAKTEQYQLSEPAFVLIDKEDMTDLYEQLVNRSLTDGSTTKKLRLPKENYVLTITGDAGKLVLDQTNGAMLVKAKEDIPRASGVTAEIAILDNTGSQYSKAVFKLTTEAPPSGGGGGGGSVPETPPTPARTNEPYIAGYPDKTFRADAQVSREEIAKMLISVLGEQVAEQTVYTSFTDVEKSRWSAPYIERAARLQYLQGDPGGTFRPASAMTRAELAACLARAAAGIGRKAGEAKDFSDVGAEKWYAESVASAASLGLITGYADGTFRPENNVTRAEAVAMMNRLAARHAETASGLQTLDCPFSDVQKTDWAYLQIMEAAVQHSH